MILTLNDFSKILPKADASQWFQPLSSAMASSGLITPKRIAAFLATVAVESAELSTLTENLSYRAETLLTVWPNRFDPAMARRYAGKPEQIANIAYAGRMGNGNAQSGDGWRFRGRGPIQITGRDTYRLCGECLGADLLADPTLLLTPRYGARSAVWFFAVFKSWCVEAADRGDMARVTRLVNGGSMHMDRRMKYYDRAMKVLAG